MLLYLVKHSCPDLDNATRELSKANDDANSVAYKEILYVINCVINMKKPGIKIKPTSNSNKPWEFVCFSNSDYAGDLVSR